MDKTYLEGLELKGICNTPEREKVIEAAITELQTKPDGAFKSKYMGIKNYSAFGDQREDHAYSMGPRHGSIVFSIGRNHDHYRAENAQEYIAILITFRDDDGFNYGGRSNLNIQQIHNLYTENVEMNKQITKHFNKGE